VIILFVGWMPGLVQEMSTLGKPFLCEAFCKYAEISKAAIGIISLLGYSYLVTLTLTPTLTLTLTLSLNPRLLSSHSFPALENRPGTRLSLRRRHTLRPLQSGTDH